MKTLINIFAIIFALIAFSCTTKINVEAEKVNLLKADKEWSEAAHSNEMEKLLSFWGSGAKVLVSANKTLNGLDQIKEFTTRARMDPNFSISWVAQGCDVSPSGDMGYTYGTGEVTRTGDNGETVTATKPYLIVWIKDDDGKWKCAIEN